MSGFEAQQPHRLAAGGVIDRAAPMSFTFDGARYSGYRGDTLASALLANGVRLVGRSFKYHRPRGVFTAGAEEPNALVELRLGARREPNTKATTIELYDGLSAASQNRWPSLRADMLAANQLAAPFLAGGFYYKTFMWPASFWEKVYEPIIRRAAGLGRASGAPDPDRYEKATAFCDVLVIGGGPAGLSAALAAGRSGARVILCDHDFALGGRLLSDRREIDGKGGAQWAREAEAELEATPEVRIFRRTQVFGAYDGGTYAALESVNDHAPFPPPHQPRQRLWRFVAKRCVNASGALERPIVFGGNDRPGVMLASAARAYANRFAVAPGERAAVFTATDEGWAAAADLAALGVMVEAVIDPREDVRVDHIDALARAGARILLSATVIATRGRGRLRRVDARDKAGRNLSFDVDALAVSGGFNPQIGLATHQGERGAWSEALSSFIVAGAPPGMTLVGAAAGVYPLAACLRAGAEAGARAATELGFAAPSARSPRADDEASGAAAFWFVENSRGKAFVDLQNDVTAADVAIAYREGFRSVEHLKRYTTLGMATDQGKTSNVNGQAIMAALCDRTIAQGGTTAARPPHLPVAIGALAGQHRGKDFKPTRYVPGHRWALDHGATVIEAGQWLRPQWFARPGETDWLTIVSREAAAVRASVGVCDVSTLGKIDLKGADAGAFLDRVYANTMATLPIGKCRYGVMLREDGFVLDDGVVARLGEEHYLVSTTTAHAARVMRHLDFCHQVLWPELRVAMVSVSDQWAQYAVAGPQSRALLERLLGPTVDISNATFPYLACRPVMVAGVAGRLFRVSFSGELAYEIAAPARYGDALLGALMEAGASLGATLYGVEALSVLRIERGHMAGGELNGQTTAHDLGLGRMMSKKKDYIGRVMGERPALAAPERPRLIGLKPVNASARLRAGAHFLKLGADGRAENDEGHVTSVAYSPAVRSWIGLGLLINGPARLGERMRAYDPVRNGDVEVEVVAPCFVDADGERLHG